jgi:L-tyrosine isonitrile synthase
MSDEIAWGAGYRMATHAAVSCAGYHPRNLDAAPQQSGRSAKNGRHINSAKKTVTAEAVLRSFNTWAFKREQPADPQLMLRMISESISLGEPVSFVLYWGKGPRCRLGEPDIECLDYLGALAQRVREAYEPGAAVKLIFTDTHAKLNGYAPLGVREYFAEVAACAGERGFEACFLSELTRSEAAAACATNDDSVPEETLQRLSASARKWYRGDGTAGQGALKYFQMNMIEKRAVELAFPGSIFVTFNGSDLRRLFPDCLPIFYMYSLRRGVSVKPWFLPAPEADNSKNSRSVDLP